MDADQPVATAPFSTLIDAASLQALLNRQGAAPPCLLDASFDLTDAAAGKRAYREAHVPGALHVDLHQDLSGPKQPDGRGGRHPLPERAVFAATAGRLGVRPERQVVVYDRSGGFYASRAWWLLRWLGHAAVAVLDGSLPAWVAQVGALEAGDSIAPGGPPYPDAPALVETLDADTLQSRLGRWPLIDARAAERFRGDVEPLDPRAGHIPGAVNRHFQLNLMADGRFKPVAELRAAFGELIGDSPPAEVAHQCGSGITACHNLLAMAHAGLHGSRLYAGSWSEWSADPARPVAVGLAGD